MYFTTTKNLKIKQIFKKQQRKWKKKKKTMTFDTENTLQAAGIRDRLGKLQGRDNWNVQLVVQSWERDYFPKKSV